MDLLTSVLKTVQAEEYASGFEKHGIDTFSLKLLCEEDLEIVGITDKLQRESLLKNIANLQIPAEKRKDIVVDEAYAKLVLFQISNHLDKHYANLSCALARKDIIVVNVKLGPGVKCLKECVESFEAETKKFRRLVSGSNKKKRNFVPTLILCTLLASSSVLIMKFVMKS